jgi:citrate lyase beta subunit
MSAPSTGQMPGQGSENPYRTIRSILETPILDEHKWSKVPSIPADAVILDMEDSVPTSRKEEARAKVVDWLRDPRGLRGKLLLPRCNSLTTPFGRGDLEALAEAGARVVVYPKLSDPAELAEVRQILNGQGCDPDIFVIVETARAVLELEDVAGSAKVRALMFGPADLASDAGFEMYVHDPSSGRKVLAHDSYAYVRSKLVLAGAAYGLATFDMVFVDDLADLDAVSDQARQAKRQGFTGMATFYPAHVEVINRELSPTEAEIADATEVVETYEAALSEGRAAVSLGGRALIVQDYKSALRVLARARIIAR